MARMTKLDGLMMAAVLVALGALVAMICSGCAVTRISSETVTPKGDHIRFSANRVSFLTDFRARGFEIGQSASGQPLVKWTSLDQDATKAAKDIAKGAVEGAL